MNAHAPNPLDLSGGHYLITGAASGIGRATAELFASLGARISLIDCDEAPLAELVANLPNGPHIYRTYDLADVEGIDNLVRDIVSANGLLQGMVHAAGTQVVMPARDIKPAIWRRILAVNTDDEAPMMTKATYAVVGDMHEVVPAIIEEIRRRRG